ncbi:hypothetical protein RJT34_22245 [Clitoria ternatea]|uniref:RING-type domain-containing protein n=1 Tax=Clitoria ternatea TaxID=43366 RepID=A0AAN9IVW5_CLITE
MMSTQGLLLDGVYIFNAMNSTLNNRSTRSLEDNVHIINSLDLVHNHSMQGNGRSLRSNEDVHIFDSIDFNHSYNRENNARVVPTTQESYRKFENVRIQDASSMCSICLGVFPNGSKAIRLPKPCSHIFHQQCITTWLNIKNTCPLCRRTV